VVNDRGDDGDQDAVLDAEQRGTSRRAGAAGTTDPRRSSPAEAMAEFDEAWQNFRLADCPANQEAA
jgi:hypothetical protein